MENEELDNIIVLNDENGNEVKFEFLDLVELEEEEYVVLLPVSEEGEEDAVDPRLPAALLRKNAVCARIDELTQIQQGIEAMKPNPTQCRFECSTVYPPTMLTISGAIWKFDEIKNSCIARLDKETGEVVFS